jgi:T5SS/PEP-CTERM-associated repeat protein
MADLGVLNAATGLADLMSGTFQTSGTGCINNGLTTFSGLGAGQGDTAPSVSLSTAQAGTFTESITLEATGSNSSFYSGTLAPRVLTVTRTVVATPRTLEWIGGNGTSFSNPLNWDDFTDGLYSAQTAPTAIDTTEFNVPNGVLAGTLAVTTLAIGASGSGALQIDARSSITAGALSAGVGAGAVGQIGVTGSGAILAVTGTAAVAGAGIGALAVLAGATVTAEGLTVASQNGSSGQLNISGAGSYFFVSGPATVADDGTAVLSVTNGASFAAQSLTIGSLTDSSGALIVSGNNTTLTVSGELNIGTADGTCALTVGPGAVVDAAVVNLQGGVILEGGQLNPTVYIENGGSTTGGFGTIASDFILLEGTILSNGSKSGKQTEVVQGTVVGGGTADIKGSVSVNGPGILQIGTHDTIELTGAVLNAATTTFTNNLTPTGTYSVNNSVVDVVFQDGTGVLQLDDIGGFAGTVATWHAGDAFVVTGGTLSNIGLSNGDTLTVQDSGTNAGSGGIDTIIFGSPVIAGGFSIVGGDTIVACFAAGTAIETAEGPVAVEDLRLGQRLLTAEGTCEPIVWIGSRVVNCARHAAPETVWPVRVRAGAFGDAVPSRDLYLSPDYAVFVNDVLIPVKQLINGTSIAQVKRASVAYYHIELPDHSVILAEGLPVESYLDTGDRALYESSPEFNARMWEMGGCASLHVIGVIVERTRGQLRARSAVSLVAG